MGNFGEDLRMERLSRGIALEQITEVTKISRRHLLALEQEKFRLLPGGILSKGIVRGYVGALGLDTQDWTDRFLRASGSSAQADDDDRSWMTFASNVGKARIQRRDALELRMRWMGAILLLLVVLAAAYLTVCASIGVAPAEVLHIGDRYDLDVLAARAAGLAAVHLDRDDAGPHEEPHRLTSLARLGDYLDAVG